MGRDVEHLPARPASRSMVVLVRNLIGASVALADWLTVQGRKSNVRTEMGGPQGEAVQTRP